MSHDHMHEVQYLGLAQSEITRTHMLLETKLRFWTGELA
jgi:hypothetical protein